MQTKEVIDALEAWATATIPALSSYDHEPELVDQSLPMVIAEIQRGAVSKSEGGSNLRALQQVTQQPYVRLWRVQMLLLVTPDPAWNASQSLYDYEDALGASLRSDTTLGQRVELALPTYEADYTPAEVEIGDGLLARAMRFELTVAEQVAS